MYKFLSVMLIASAVSTPAYADIFGLFSANGGPEQMTDGNVYAPTQNGVVDGSLQGYPFYSGCCDSGSSCQSGLWDGYCGSKGCGMKGHLGRHHGGLLGGFGCGSCCVMGFGHSPCGFGSCGKGGCGKGGCGKGGCGYGDCGKGGCGKGGCGKGGSGYGAPYGYGGLSGWGGHLGHRGLGGGKGGYGKGGNMDYAPFQGGAVQEPAHGTAPGYDQNYYGTPNEVEGNAAPQPPEVLVEPTPISDRSAGRRQVPANSFARPFSF